MIPTARNVSPAHHWHAETCHLPGRGSSWFPHFTLRGAARLSLTARIGRAPFYRARSASTKDGLAAPPPALLRPRVARARGSSRPPRPFFSIPLEHEEEVKVIHVRAGGSRDDELLELL